MDKQISFEDFKKSFDKYKNYVQEISKEDFKVLWFDDYYDGMLCGILEHDDKKYRFEIISDDVDNSIRPRLFAVIAMTENQIEEETYWNKLFQKYVGNHNNLNTDEQLRQEPQNVHHLFYDEYKKKYHINYDKNFIKFWYAEK